MGTTRTSSQFSCEEAKGSICLLYSKQMVPFAFAKLNWYMRFFSHPKKIMLLPYIRFFLRASFIKWDPVLLVFTLVITKNIPSPRRCWKRYHGNGNKRRWLISRRWCDNCGVRRASAALMSQTLAQRWGNFGPSSYSSDILSVGLSPCVPQ